MMKVVVLEEHYLHSNFHSKQATGKLAGIGKNVNYETWSNRRALQIDHELRNAKRSSPFLFFYGGNREKRK